MPLPSPLFKTQGKNGYGYSCNHVTAEETRREYFVYKYLIIIHLHDIFSNGYRKKVTWLQV